MSEQQDGQSDGAEVHVTDERVDLSNDLARRFAYHPPTTESRRTAHEQVRTLCHDLAERLADLVPPGRERSSAFTSVEAAMMWSNAGIARLYADGEHATVGGTQVRHRTAGSLGLTPQQVDPAPVPGGTQNPASLVDTEDMPAPDGGGEPVVGVLVETTDGGSILVGENALAVRPSPAAAWDTSAEAWADE